MNNTQLEELLRQVCSSVEGESGQWQVVYKDKKIICLTDESHDRMRFISAIAKMDEISEEQLRFCMSANFDRALDARYCVSRDILWAAFIHPLSELSEDFAADALNQVANLAENFGTSYASGGLTFGSE